MLESEWDATAGKINEAKLGERVNGYVAREAEAQVRRQSLPANETGYEAKNSADFKLPEGVTFQFDPASPELAAARKLALKHGLSQEAFSGLLDLYASTKISEQTTAAKARETNLAQLGAAGPQRVEAVATWLGARAGDAGKATADFLRKYPSAPIVNAMENLMRQFSNQGGTDYSQQHRATETQEAGKIPGYDGMNFVQRRAAQMAQKLSNAGGSGR